MLKVSHPLHKTPAGHMRRRPEFSNRQGIGYNYSIQTRFRLPKLRNAVGRSKPCIMSASKAWEVIGNSREKAPFATLEKKRYPWRLISCMFHCQGSDTSGHCLTEEEVLKDINHVKHHKQNQLYSVIVSYRVEYFSVLCSLTPTYADSEGALFVRHHCYSVDPLGFS